MLRKLSAGEAAVEMDGATFLDRMIEGTPFWPKRTIPGWPGEVRIRPLGRGLEQACHVAALKWAKREGIDPDQGAGKELYEERAAQLILYEALVTGDSDPAHPEAAKPLARDVDEFINHPALTDAVITFFWREYNDVKMRCSPDIEDLSEELINELVAEIKKNQCRTLVELLPRRHVEDLAISTALRVPD